MEIQERPTATPLLSVTEAAAVKIKQLMAEESDVSVLRVAIQGGGCSGFQYGLGFDSGAAEGDLEFHEHGVTVVFVTLPNTKIELLEPLGEASPIARFLERNPDGGIHHVCYEVDDIISARDRLKAAGARVLGDGEPKVGAHGKPVLFLHPKDFCGTLVELEQA